MANSIASITQEEILDRYYVLLLDAFGVLMDASGALPGAVAWVERIGGAAFRHFVASGERRVARFIDAVYRHHGPQGILARTWPTGSTVLWVAVLLTGTLFLYYL